jgi:hypothetical protein
MHLQHLPVALCRHVYNARCLLPSTLLVITVQHTTVNFASKLANCFPSFPFGTTICDHRTVSVDPRKKTHVCTRRDITVSRTSFVMQAAYCHFTASSLRRMRALVPSTTPHLRICMGPSHVRIGMRPSHFNITRTQIIRTDRVRPPVCTFQLASSRTEFHAIRCGRCDTGNNHIIGEISSSRRGEQIMEAVSTSEMSVNFRHTTQHSIPEGSHL